MEFDVIYSEERNFFVVKTNGVMTGSGFVKMGEALLGHESFSEGNGVIFDHVDLDFRGVALAELNKIRQFHQENEKEIGNGKSAIVVGPELIDHWNNLWSQGNKIETENQSKVFDDFTEAVVWMMGL